MAPLTSILQTDQHSHKIRLYVSVWKYDARQRTVIPIYFVILKKGPNISSVSLSIWKAIFVGQEEWHIH